MPADLPPLPPAAITSAVPLGRAESGLVRQINRVRRARGLRAVRVTLSLTRVARQHSSAMLAHDRLTHSSFDGSSFSGRLARGGKRVRYGETLAWAPHRSRSTAGAIIGMWMRSPGHRAVLLDGSLRRIGIARVWGAMGAQQGHAITADFSS